jgi:4-amino-4-deoxy-L-arabinose transferase-like glycosyltransferase
MSTDSFKTILKLAIPWWPALLPIGLALWTLLASPEQYDEIYHLHFSQYIAEHPTWHTIATYEGSENNEAKAPFLFILAAGLGTVFGFTLVVMRLLVLLFAMVAVFFFRQLTQLTDSQIGTTRSCFVVALPYFLILSITFMTDLPTLALMFIASYGLLRNVYKLAVGHLLCSMAASTCMLYTRVDAAVALAGIGLAVAAQGSMSLRLLVGIAVPVLLRLPLVFVWKGLTPPPAQAGPIAVTMGFHMVNLVFSLCVTGLYFFPFAFHGLKERILLRLAVAAVALALFFAFPLRFTDTNLGLYAGTLRSFSERAISNNGLLRSGFLAVLLLVGSQILLNFCWPMGYQTIPVQSFQYCTMLSIGMQTLRGVIVYDRYLLMPFGFLLILVLRQYHRSILYYPWVAGLVVLQLFQCRMHHIL